MKVKNIILQQRLVYYVVMILLFASCKGGVSTTPPTEITPATALVGGNVKATTKFEIIERGVCYSTTPKPTTKQQKIESGKGSGPFTVVIDGLLANTTYYVRAYIISHKKKGPTVSDYKTRYGNEVSFTTSNAVLATITTTNESLTSYGGSIEKNGGSPVKERGICYSTHPGPTLSDNIQTAFNNERTMTFQLYPSFTPRTIYYVRAYATNSVGTAYGNELVAGIAGIVREGNGWEGATLYDPSIKGIHAVICDFQQAYPKEWSPTSPGSVELIITKDERAVFRRTCTYGFNEVQIKMYSSEETYTIHEAKTGKVIAKRIFLGPNEECQDALWYKEGHPPQSHRSTTYPSGIDIMNWIQSFVVK